MDCREIHLAYKDFIAGNLPAALSEFIQEHILDCPDCILLDQEERNLFLAEHHCAEKDESLDG